MKKLLLILLFAFPLFLYAQESISYNTKEGSTKFSISSNQYYIEFGRANREGIILKFQTNPCWRTRAACALLL